MLLSALLDASADEVDAELWRRVRLAACQQEAAIRLLYDTLQDGWEDPALRARALSQARTLFPATNPETVAFAAAASHAAMD